MTDRADVRDWLQQQDWARLQQHFAHTPPTLAEEFEARALSAMALWPGGPGLRLALPDLQRVCAMQPHNTLAAANLMQALMDVGDVATALTLTTDAMRQAPYVAVLAEKHALALAAAGRWADAQSAVDHARRAADAVGQAQAPAVVDLASELAWRWWAPESMGGVVLRLPAPGDEGFVARCFAAQDFMRRYRRFQVTDDDALRAFIDLGTRRPRMSGRFEWVVETNGEAIGLASLSDLNPAHRRAELLVGLLNPAQSASAGLKASLAVLHFGFDRLGLHKLVSYVYGDNPTAQANTLHLGLRQEGYLRHQLLTADGALDLYANGLLADEFHVDQRLQRLIARWRGR